MREYLVDRNATQAAIRAGYSAKTADVKGSQLLGSVRPILAPLLAEQDRLLVQKTEITAERVMRELGRLAFYDARKFFDARGQPIAIPDLHEDESACVAGFETQEIDGKVRSVTKKYRLADKLGALNLLAKRFRLVGDDDANRLRPVTILIQDAQPVTIEGQEVPSNGHGTKRVQVEIG